MSSPTHLLEQDHLELLNTILTLTEQWVFVLELAVMILNL